jgi:uncharacterized membrane protein
MNTESNEEEVCMAISEHAIDVNCSARKAYNQWTQFEDFPKFMESVEEVQQLDDKTLYWRAKVAGKEESWQATITEQVPDKLIEWRSEFGAENGGRVTFEELDAGHCRITLQISYEPESLIEKVGDALGFVDRRIEGDLERFRDFVEETGTETGAWRGEIHAEEEQRPDA